MKKILNIVITGGPCGGKTTAIDEIAKFLRSYGYHIELVSETATELMSSGVKTAGVAAIDLKLFQSILLDLQIAKEKARRLGALGSDYDKIAILYDRGVLDNRAYITDEIFDEFLKERNMTENEIISSYDIVIHLVTAAIGKEEYYTTDNNAARSENIEEARAQDMKTRRTWRNHPNLHIIGNEELFNAKIEKAKNVIRSYLGEKEVITKERYVVSLNDIYFGGITHDAIEEKIEEFLLKYDNDKVYVYSKSTIYDTHYYYCSRYILENDGSYKTVCKAIDKKEYLENFAKVNEPLIKEIRYNFIDEGERFRLTLYLVDDEWFALLERDVVNEDRKELPSFIKNAINITNNTIYNGDNAYVDNAVQKIFKKKH